MSDNEIDEYLGGKDVASKRLGAALKKATKIQIARAYALLLKVREAWIATTKELSIVDRAIKEFDKKNYSHPSIARYLVDRVNEIF